MGLLHTEPLRILPDLEPLKTDLSLSPHPPLSPLTLSPLVPNFPVVASSSSCCCLFITDHTIPAEEDPAEEDYGDGDFDDYGDDFEED
jgi:hypothetical protein